MRADSSRHEFVRMTCSLSRPGVDMLDDLVLIVEQIPSADGLRTSYILTAVPFFSGTLIATVYAALCRPEV